MALTRPCQSPRSAEKASPSPFASSRGMTPALRGLSSAHAQAACTDTDWSAVSTPKNSPPGLRASPGSGCTSAASTPRQELGAKAGKQSNGSKLDKRSIAQQQAAKFSLRSGSNQQKLQSNVVSARTPPQASRLAPKAVSAGQAATPHQASRISSDGNSKASVRTPGQPARHTPSSISKYNTNTPASWRASATKDITPARPYYSRKARPVPQEEYSKYQVVAVDDPALACRLDGAMLALDLIPQLLAMATERAEARSQAKASKAAAIPHARVSHAAVKPVAAPSQNVLCPGDVDVRLPGAWSSPSVQPGCKCVLM